jgi:hypothetical protein
MAGRCRLILASIVPLLLTACPGTYRAKDTVTSQPNGLRCDSIFIAVPTDGGFDGKPSVGSGQFVAHRAAEEFSKFARKAEIAPSDLQGRADLLAAARNAGAAYLVLPEITHWEQRYTAYDGRPSGATINMTIVEAESDRQVVSTVLEGESGHGLFVETSASAAATRVIRDFVRDLCGAARSS